MAFRSMRFDRPVVRSWDNPSESGGLWRVIAAATAIAFMLIGMGVWFTLGTRHDYANERDAKTFCLLHAASPRAELTMLDQTDSLAADSGQYFMRLVTHIRETLPRNGRLAIVPFSGDLGAPLIVVFDVCSPGRGSEADQVSEGALKMQRDYEALFARPLENVARALAAPRESAQSPIAAQILRAANDPTIGWSGKDRVLNLMTDGLENTATSRVYADGVLHLPPPPPELLRGVTVNYYELASARHSNLQTPPVRVAWKAWFEAAGATVNMYAPGYAVPRWRQN